MGNKYQGMTNFEVLIEATKAIEELENGRGLNVGDLLMIKAIKANLEMLNYRLGDNN